MRLHFLIFSIILLFFSSCGSVKTLIIADHQADCLGISEKKCLLVKESENDAWENFSDPIDGFTYEKGFTYVIEVKVTKIKNPPADASEIKYTLVSIISKNKTQLETVLEGEKQGVSVVGKWTVSQLIGVEMSDVKKPFFEVKDSMIFGHTSCNTFNGSIAHNETTSTFNPGVLRMTQMACAESMKIEQAFLSALEQATSYKIMNTHELLVFDNVGAILFKAVSTQENKNLSTVIVSEKQPKNTQKSFSISYGTSTRGFSKSIEWTQNLLVEKSVAPKKYEKEIIPTQKEINEITSLFQKLNIQELPKLRPPSLRHQLDGAKGASLVITVDGQTYKTLTFDDGNPPLEVRDLIDALQRISKK